jgi:hypothetical protein
VVKALDAQRLPETLIVLVMHPAAGHADAVLTGGRVAPHPAPPGLAVRSERSGVHRSEARGGEGDEHERVRGHARRDALPASEAGGDEVVGVLAVALSALRADRLAAVAARLAEDSVRLAGG